MSEAPDSQEHVQRGVVSAVGSIGLATLASRVLGYVRDMVVARAFGQIALAAGDRARLGQRWPILHGLTPPAGSLWIAWPILDVWREGNAAMREKRRIRLDLDMSDALWVSCRHHDAQLVIDDDDIAHAQAARRTRQGLPVTRRESLQQQKLRLAPAA